MPAFRYVLKDRGTLFFILSDGFISYSLSGVLESLIYSKTYCNSNGFSPLYYNTDIKGKRYHIKIPEEDVNILAPFLSIKKVAATFL